MNKTFLKVAPINKIGNEIVSIEDSQIFREFERDERKEIIEYSLQKTKNTGIKSTVSKIVGNTSRGKNTSELKKIISTKGKEKTLEVNRVFKSETTTNYGEGTYYILSKNMRFIFTNKVVDFAYEEEIVTKGVLKERLDNILEFKNFDESFELICLESTKWTKLFQEKIKDVPEIELDVPFQNPYLRFKEDIDKIHWVLNYDGNTTSRYWGDGNLRRRQHSAMNHLNNMKKEMGLE